MRGWQYLCQLQNVDTIMNVGKRFSICMAGLRVLLVTGTLALEIAWYFYLDKRWQNMLRVSFFNSLRHVRFISGYLFASYSIPELCRIYEVLWASALRVWLCHASSLARNTLSCTPFPTKVLAKSIPGF